MRRGLPAPGVAVLATALPEPRSPSCSVGSHLGGEFDVH